MPRRTLTAEDTAKLDGLTSRFRLVADLFIAAVDERCAKEACSHKLVYGRRSLAKQLEIWATGRRLTPGANPWTKRNWIHIENVKVLTRAFPGESPHNFAEAIDLALTDNKGWLADDDTRWSIIGDCAADVGLVWGGHFDDPDCAHVEHPQWRERKLEWLKAGAKEEPQ